MEDGLWIYTPPMESGSIIDVYAQNLEKLKQALMTDGGFSNEHADAILSLFAGH
ncbi:exodeoxyribonuclease VII large subunit [Acetobacter orientalis]|uniref:Exodeoxyribonuclease VII large subunit n=1 Tax=Acetobacter orientalis TaxID=146474 RepID=A0A2Z5ZLH8_9PROT|nr:exodeoxyribonuclease VII large subunit [Acetobacter orientalis]